MKRIILLAVFALALAACGPLMEQPQVLPTPRADATPEATVAVVETTAEATQAAIEATESATPEPTVEATAEVTTEATTEPTEVAQSSAEVVVVADAGLVGDRSLGETLFREGAHGAVPCAGCHSVENDARLVGPGLLSVAERAETRVEGMTAAEYLYQSIVDPSALVVAGYFNMMPKDFGQLYSDEEINALVAYMLSLKQTQVAAASAG